tara:strand:- start:56 stop:490 length:435 start_codon:yes stop_codon:yes gene_type:complete
MKLKLVNKSKHQTPSYTTSGSSGMDIRANIINTIILNPAERVSVPTGLFLEIPLGFEIQIRPRSGLAIKNGITVLNTPGTIDADYRGEIGVILINHSDIQFLIKDGDRIAQLVLTRVEKIDWECVDSLTVTERGEGGFGSTGII